MTQKEMGRRPANASGGKPTQEAIKAASSRRAQWFGMILYPDDPDHVWMLNYLEDKAYVFQYAYILHDRDVWEDDGHDHKKGDLKKPHYHVIYKLKTRSTASAQTKFWLGVHNEAVSNPESYLMYMLHATPESRHKTPYSRDELKGVKSVLDMVTEENSNFVQLREFARMARDGATIADMIDAIESDTSKTRDDKNMALSLLLSHGTFIGVMSNQEIARRNRRSASDDLIRQVREEIHKAQFEDSVRQFARDAYTQQDQKLFDLKEVIS